MQRVEVALFDEGEPLLLYGLLVVEDVCENDGLDLFWIVYAVVQAAIHILQTLFEADVFFEMFPQT